MTPTDSSSSNQSRKPQVIKAAVLAVGTELTDGQIVDRNSALISQNVARAGIQVIEHRSVADEREDIERALRELSQRAQILFVTGGLGPTSDDFTREVLSSYFGLPLEFDEDSWKQLSDKLTQRGVSVSPSHRQECLFPRTARVLENPLGTANAFVFETQGVRVYALPGPPPEIASVWEKCLNDELDSFVDPADREELLIYRCLGKGESFIADRAEDILKGSGLRVGYRAHAPYVEVKVWVRAAQKTSALPFLQKLEVALSEWIINHNHEDVADDFLTRIRDLEARFTIYDSATGGFLQKRLGARAKELKLLGDRLSLFVETAFTFTQIQKRKDAAQGFEFHIGLNASETGWMLQLRSEANSPHEIEVLPPLKSQAYHLRSERARRFITEKALHLAVRELLAAELNRRESR